MWVLNVVMCLDLGARKSRSYPWLSPAFWISWCHLSNQTPIWGLGSLEASRLLLKFFLITLVRRNDNDWYSSCGYSIISCSMSCLNCSLICLRTWMVLDDVVMPIGGTFTSMCSYTSYHYPHLDLPIRRHIPLASNSRRVISFLNCEGFVLTALFEGDLERFYSLTESHKVPWRLKAWRLSS